jgi:lipid A oxidase
MPPYYGVRGTWWTSDRLGFGAEFTHTKVYASDATKRDNGFSVLEMTDGLNVLVANVMYRWPNGSAWTPYVGGGLGINVPHIEVTTAGGRTFEYQFGGPSAALVAGVSYSFNDHWAAFGEYRGVYSRVDTDLESGGNLKTNVITNAINIGVSYRF